MERTRIAFVLLSAQFLGSKHRMKHSVWEVPGRKGSDCHSSYSVMFGKEILWKWSHWFSYLFFLKGFHIKFALSSDKPCLWEATLRKRSYRSRPLWRAVLWYRERPNAQKPEWSLSPSTPSRTQQPHSQVRARWLSVAIELLYLFGSSSPLHASGLHLFTIKPWIGADELLHPPLSYITICFSISYNILQFQREGNL